MPRNQPPDAESPQMLRANADAHSGSARPDTESGEVPLVLWAPAAPAAPRRGVGAWALFFAVVGLIAAMFVGWGFPVSLMAVVTSAVALRRPVESRTVAGWALALGLLGLIYSAAWLAWGAMRAGVFG